MSVVYGPLHIPPVEQKENKPNEMQSATGLQLKYQRNSEIGKIGTFGVIYHSVSGEILECMYDCMTFHVPTVSLHKRGKKRKQIISRAQCEEGGERNARKTVKAQSIGERKAYLNGRKTTNVR